MTFIASALGFLKGIPREVWLIAAAFVAVWWWGESRYDAGQEAERIKRDRIVAEAVLKAVQVERDAQKAFEGREDERQAETRDLRKAAAEAGPGERTQAVLDALRNS